ncbi:hypothetical protein [Deinococcus rufus]|uniref:Uncharacterized protein n=1 Tax=Deinococcus rufus TaxID=2136097 RepID=A0ABV7ZB07_9DEIO
MSLLAGLKLLKDKDGEGDGETPAPVAEVPRPARPRAPRQSTPRAAASVPAATPVPATPPPAPPPSKLTRESLGTRVQAPYKAALDQFVYGLKAEGWPIQHHHVMELLLDQLRSEEGRARLREQLAGRLSED